MPKGKTGQQRPATGPTSLGSEAVPQTAREFFQFRRSPDGLQAARLQGLRNLARWIWVDRNAAGMPARYRAEIKLSVRGKGKPMTDAIRNVCLARRALLAGDVVRYERLRDAARIEMQHAAILFRQPFMAQVARQRPGRVQGAVTANQQRAKLPEARVLAAEIAALSASTGCDVLQAKARMGTKYRASRQAINAKLRKLKGR